MEIKEEELVAYYFLCIILPTTYSPQSLLCDPNPNSPANSEAAKLYGENRREYNKRVKEIVELSWMDSPAGEMPLLHTCVGGGGCGVVMI